MEEGIVLIEGKTEGPTSVVLAGVHGNEQCGVVAFRELLPSLKLDCGKAYFILGNPQAIEKNQRLLEFNLNRGFLSDEHYLAHEKSTYEYARAQLIKQYLDKASALLDIHSTHSASPPFLFCESVSFAIARQLPDDFELIVTGVESIEPGGSDGYMSRQGKIGICLECGQHEAPHVFDLAKRSILAFLQARGHIQGALRPAPRTPKRAIVDLNYAYYTQTTSFQLVRPFQDFEAISQGTPIGKDGEETVLAPRDGLIVFARNCIRPHTEGFLLGQFISP